jgi:hypothetical protein
MRQATCLLPGGYWDANGVLHREAELTALTGSEEELLADKTPGAAAGLVTALLARCVRCIGTVRPVTEDVARDLLVGDRQYLLIKLRQLTFGDKVDATIRCPWPDCGEPVDIDFAISEVPVKEVGARAPLHDAELSPEAAATSGFGPDAVRARFRLPNGGDQEALVPLLARNEAEALTQLLCRCICSIGAHEHASQEHVRNLSPAARLEIERQMEKAAPGMDLAFEAKCPQCGRAFPVPFDAEDFLFGEVRHSRDLLHREIHYLAYHYHWGEREILEMTRDKRRRYIEILSDEMERLNSASA